MYELTVNKINFNNIIKFKNKKTYFFYIFFFFLFIINEN